MTDPQFHLALNEDQHRLVANAHAFARDVIRPVAARHDRDEEFPWNVLEQAAREGFYSPVFYRDLIGDPTGLSLPLFMEEIFWGCAGIGLTIVLPALALAAIAQATDDYEELRHWARECFGEPGKLKTAALAVTEAAGGSDVSAIETRAERSAGGWVLNGRKIFIGNGGIADVHVVVASVDPEAAHRGQGVFIVRKDTPGLKLVRKLEKLGCRASHTAEIAFDDCKVPSENLLGGEDKLQARIERGRAKSADGSAALGAFEQTRPMVGAQAIGIARAAFEYARDYGMSRETFRRPIIENQGIAFPLADIAAEIDAARLLVWRAAWMAAQGIEFRQGEGSMSKLKASEVAVKATEQAVQTLGGWGYIKDHPVEKWYRDAKLYTIFEGTSEIQRLVIGRALTTAPNDPLHHAEVSSDPSPVSDA